MKDWLATIFKLIKINKDKIKDKDLAEVKSDAKDFPYQRVQRLIFSNIKHSNMELSQNQGGGSCAHHQTKTNIIVWFSGTDLWSQLQSRVLKVTIGKFWDVTKRKTGQICTCSSITVWGARGEESCDKKARFLIWRIKVRLENYFILGWNCFGYNCLYCWTLLFGWHDFGKKFTKGKDWS